MLKICADEVYSIKRVLATHSYILKTLKEGVKLLTFKEEEEEDKQFSIQDLLEAEESSWGNFTDSLQLQVTQDHVLIAAIENQEPSRRGIKVMRVPLTEM